jgi:hypothetical protein
MLLPELLSPISAQAGPATATVSVRYRWRLSGNSAKTVSLIAWSSIRRGGAAGRRHVHTALASLGAAGKLGAVLSSTRRGSPEGGAGTRGRDRSSSSGGSSCRAAAVGGLAAAWQLEYRWRHRGASSSAAQLEPTIAGGAIACTWSERAARVLGECSFRVDGAAGRSRHTNRADTRTRTGDPFITRPGGWGSAGAVWLRRARRGRRRPDRDARTVEGEAPRGPDSAALILLQRIGTRRSGNAPPAPASQTCAGRDLASAPIYPGMTRKHISEPSIASAGSAAECSVHRAERIGRMDGVGDAKRDAAAQGAAPVTPRGDDMTNRPSAAVLLCCERSRVAGALAAAALRGKQGPLGPPFRADRDSPSTGRRIRRQKQRRTRARPPAWCGEAGVSRTVRAATAARPMRAPHARAWPRLHEQAKGGAVRRVQWHDRGPRQPDTARSVRGAQPEAGRARPRGDGSDDDRRRVGLASAPGWTVGMDAPR